MQRLVVLSGSGISAESGLKTFRDSGGLWEGYNVYEVATPEAWERNPELVLDFYNQRRRQVVAAQPNEAHRLLVALEKKYDVTIITQNVDDLHERAGSTCVLHLHGEIMKSRSSVYDHLVYPTHGKDIKLGNLCEKGYQLRPHVVWFGEPVPAMSKAIEFVKYASVFLVIGTSLQVYPAASLIDYVPPSVPVYLIDPHLPESTLVRRVKHIAEPATVGMQIFYQEVTELAL